MTAREIQELETRLRSLGNVTDAQIRAIVDSINALNNLSTQIRNMDSLFQGLNEASRKFNESVEMVFENSTKRNHGVGSNDFELDLRKAVAQLKREFNNAAQQERENSENRKRALDELNRLEQSRLAQNAQPEQKEYIENQVRLLKSEINLQTEKENLEKKRISNLAANNELEEKLLKQKVELYDKNEQINRVKKEAEAKREKWEKKGYNDSGRKNSGYEIFSKIGDVAKSLRENSIGRSIGNGLAGLSKGASSTLNFIDSGKMDVSATASKVSGTLSQMGPYGAAAGAAVDILAKLFEMYSKVDTAASKFARSVGGGRATLAKMRMEGARMAAQFSELGGRAYDAAKIIETMAEYSQTLGRNVEFMSDASIKAMQDLKDYGIGMDIISQFDTFGISVETTSEKMAELYKNAGKRGLNVKVVTDTMTKNLRMAQNYTFSRGLKGLEAMAQKSVSLKYNIEQAARFADKVSSLEGAAGAAAQLSVLGGDFARYGNPLQMLYGGLQDVETLNEMTNKITKNLAYFDEDKGQIEINAADRQRLRAMASETGMDYGELVNMSMTQGRRRKIDDDLDRSGTHIKDEDVKEFIRNIAELDAEGKAYVKMGTKLDENGHEVDDIKYLNKLKDNDYNELKKLSDAKSSSVEDNVGGILEETRSIQEKLDDFINAIKAKLVNALIKYLGPTDTERGKLYGLNSEYADLFEEMSDDYHGGLFGIAKGLGNNAMNQLRALGISEDEIKKFDKAELSESDFENRIVEILLKAQKNGVGLQTKFNNNQYGKYNTSDWGTENFRFTNTANYNEEHRASGGFVFGRGTSISDSIPTMLSNGEYVINAKNAQQNAGLLNSINSGRINNGNNPYKFTPFVNSTNNSNNYQSQNGTMTFSPLRIDLSGKLELSANGSSKFLTADDIFTPQLINRIIKEIQVQTDYSFNRNKVNWKYGVDM